MTRSRKQNPVVTLSHVIVTVPQADTSTVLQVDGGEQQQSSAVASSTELVLPGKDDSVNVLFAQVEACPDDIHGEQGDMDNIPHNGCNK